MYGLTQEIGDCPFYLLHGYFVIELVKTGIEPGFAGGFVYPSH